jgi:hypothetical protein
LKKLLFVAKDMGSANVTCPLARICIERGHEVTTVLEGLAAGIYEKADILPYFKGTVNYIDEPFNINAEAVLRKVKPDGVVVGLGSPINLEQSFGSAANALGIPLIECVDFWNGTNRSSAQPQVVLSIDEVDAKLSLRRHPSAKVYIVGNPGVPQFGAVKPASEVDRLREEFDKVYTYIGGSERTGDEIEFLVKCLHKTGGNWCLVPRFHPKHAKREYPSRKGITYGYVWADMLVTSLGNRIIVYLPEVKSTESVVVASNGTFSSWSTLLTTSAQAGKVTASLWVPSARKELKELTELDQVPLVDLGCCHSLVEVTDLSGLTPPDSESIAKLKPYDPRVAYEALMRSMP